MTATWKRWTPLALLATVGAALVVVACFQPARAERGEAAAAAAASGGPRYSVVETEAHNLIVTDNQTNKLYFYTIDKDKEVGSELKLRGTLDLNQVGKPMLKPERAKAE